MEPERGGLSASDAGGQRGTWRIKVLVEVPEAGFLEKTEPQQGQKRQKGHGVEQSEPG